MTSTASIFLSSPLRPAVRPEAPAPSSAAPEPPQLWEQRIRAAARTGILQAGVRNLKADARSGK